MEAQNCLSFEASALEEVDLWLTEEWNEVKYPQRLLPDDTLILVEPPAKSPEMPN